MRDEGAATTSSGGIGGGGSSGGSGGKAEGVVLESAMEKGHGVVVDILVTSGDIKVDPFGRVFSSYKILHLCLNKKEL